MKHKAANDKGCVGDDSKIRNFQPQWTGGEGSHLTIESPAKG